MSKTTRIGILLIVFLPIAAYSIILSFDSFLHTSVAERLQGQVMISGTTELSLDEGIIGDSAKPLNRTLALFGISQALDAYPISFLKKNGPNILISNNLKLYGYSVAGTVHVEDDRSWVLLSSGYLIPSFNMEYVKRTFHHEFSSLLIAGKQFPYLQWEQTLPMGFSYPTTSQQHLEATESYAPASELPNMVAAGFVSDYGMSSIENDINTYAEILLNNPTTLIEMAQKSPPVQRKAELIVNFYTGLDDQFASIFRKKGLERFLAASK